MTDIDYYNMSVLFLYVMCYIVIKIYIYRNMSQLCSDEEARARNDPAVAPRTVSMHFVADTARDQRRYGPPTADEVAAVFVGDDGRPPRDINLVMYNRNPIDAHHRMQTLSAGSRHADPMLYPVLFPYGECGWQDNMRQRGNRINAVRTRNTIREYACYRLAIRYQGNNNLRNDQFSILHRGGFLLQMYVCDLYVRMESNNLNYIIRNQGALLAEAYRGLVDHVNQQLHLDVPANPLAVGRRVILPSTFVGSPRYNKGCYHDAISIVRKFGKPDLFITFTCNPRWLEITENLGTHTLANDRPDLVARVFHVKLKALMDDITVGRIFGNVNAYVYTVEFQKRGLPHAHILIILGEDSKLLDAQDVDNIVCASLPDPETDRRLFDCVTSHMIHGPCGQLNPNSPCMVDNSCSKKFPKQYCDETVYVSDGGYPMYRRPNNGRVALVRQREVGNEFVVPYNPYLLAKYDAHINVEVCSTIKSVKYIYKYVYKGHDADHLHFYNLFIYTLLND